MLNMKNVEEALNTMYYVEYFQNGYWNTWSRALNLKDAQKTIEYLKSKEGGGRLTLRIVKHVAEIVETFGDV
jgi:DNA-directed RNA polymerase